MCHVYSCFTLESKGTHSVEPKKQTHIAQIWCLKILYIKSCYRVNVNVQLNKKKFKWQQKKKNLKLKMDLC